MTILIVDFLKLKRCFWEIEWTLRIDLRLLIYVSVSKSHMLELQLLLINMRCQIANSYVRIAPNCSYQRRLGNEQL